MQTSSSPQALDREVLAELAVDEVVSSELAFPVAVGVELVDEHGTLLATMPGEVALPVALDVELADPARAAHRILEDAREDRPALPGHVLRQADVDRHESCRLASSSRSALCRLTRLTQIALDGI